MAAAERSSGNTGGPKRPHKQNEVDASTRARVERLKENLEQIQNLFLYQVKWQEITQQNINKLQSDIGNMLQVVMILVKMPNAKGFFNGIDKFASKLIDIQQWLATQYALFEQPKRSRKAWLDFFDSYKQLLQLIAEAINLIKLP